jgi:hypothetical protein
MYIDIPANDNLDEPAMATFKETGPARAVRAVRLWREGGWQWCAVTGWGEQGPVPALLTPIEESGDGPARLVTGGDHGLRLAPLADLAAPAPATVPTVAWDLARREQWGEPFLLCTPEIEVLSDGAP